MRSGCAPVLHDEPALASASREDGVTLLWWLPDDESVAMEVADVLMAHGADPAARNRDGATAAEWARRRGMTRVAQRLEGRGSPQAHQDPV